MECLTRSYSMLYDDLIESAGHPLICIVASSGTNRDIPNSIDLAKCANGLPMQLKICINRTLGQCAPGISVRGSVHSKILH